MYLVSLDVDALYTNIENNEGLEELQEKVEQNRHARPLGWAVAKLMELVLLLNNFVFNGINFLQIKGTSMGQDALQTTQTSIWRNGKRSLCTKQHSGDTYDAGCTISMIYL